jgi:hypothetical protein
MSHKLPELVGVTEVAKLLQWRNKQGKPDKAKVSEYLKRKKLPEPIQRLASGPIWRKSDMEEYKKSLGKYRRIASYEKFYVMQCLYPTDDNEQLAQYAVVTVPGKEISTFLSTSDEQAIDKAAIIAHEHNLL